MKVVPYSEIDPAIWNELCGISDDAWLFHDASWIDIESRYFWLGNHSFGLIESDKLVAVQPLYFVESGLGSWSERLLHSGFHRHAGLAMSPELPMSLVRSVRSEAMRHILSLGEKLDVDRIQLNSQNLAPINFTARREAVPYWVLDYGFHLGVAFGPGGVMPAPGMSTCNADQIVDLSVPEDELFSHLEESCRRAVRKAISSGLTFECHEGEGGATLYYEIAEMSAKRTGESLASRAYYEDIEQAFRNRGHCVVLFAKHENRRGAALFLLLGKGSAHFLGGASDPDYLSLRVNDFLHWSALVWCRNKGFTNYRFGPSFPEVPKDWPIAKVSRFKTKFGGRAFPVIQGSLFRHPEKYREIGIVQLDQLIGSMVGVS